MPMLLRSLACSRCRVAQWHCVRGSAPECCGCAGRRVMQRPQSTQGVGPGPAASKPQLSSPQGRPAQPPGSPVASTSGQKSEFDALLEDEQFQEFYADLTDYLPTIPDTFTKNHLARCGFQTSDTRVVRLVSLAAQTFVKQIAQDAFDNCRQRKRLHKKQKGGRETKEKEKMFVLALQDLEIPLARAGARKQDIGPKPGGPPPAAVAAQATEQAAPPPPAVAQAGAAGAAQGSQPQAPPGGAAGGAPAP